MNPTHWRVAARQALFSCLAFCTVLAVALALMLIWVRLLTEEM